MSRAPYTWPFADDQLILRGAGATVAAAIAEHPEAAVLFWHCGLPEAECVDLTELAGFIDLIERDRAGLDSATSSFTAL